MKDNEINPVTTIVHNFSCEVVERQEQIIMQTIQRIGGETYTHITIDKNKVLDAFRKYTATKPTREATDKHRYTCPNCKRIVDEIREVNNGRSERRVIPDYCTHCGQALEV